ncbi:outer membrane protein OmpK [Shewanella acanthi]|uniref:outer membrane protein OmpK n=1 Tax=Shewanella acanthi TaxID=2864212 RepID=UPI001C66158B|nr:outer membrane protein OmpK [Shewanella acanthi]QYJ78740.1 hypothetical protein K0H61_16955 [Shewanella acanthi]
MKKILFCSLLFPVFISVPAQSAMLAVEAGVMDWQSKASDYFGEAKDNNPFLKLKGFTANEYGDLYGHVTLEDPDNSSMYGTEINLVGQINIGDSDWNLYGQVFDKSKPKWGETNTLLGISWDKNIANTYFQVALAGHIVDATYQIFDKDFDGGFNGGYVYLMASRDVSVFDQNLTLTWWQEHYFARNDDYLILSGDEKDFGFNGQFNINWALSESTSINLSYRYSENNLGKQGYHDAIFYSFQYKL